MFLTDQNILVLMKSSLSILSYMDNVYGSPPTSSQQTQGSLEFLLFFLLQNSWNSTYTSFYDLFGVNFYGRLKVCI
jgi:hypothetical protein